jgi:folate-dependent phosphoribosylglycinamide formyltransferase PurN
MHNKEIVLLAGKWETTTLVYNFLCEHFTVTKLVMEEPVPKKEFLKKRAKKLGWFTVGGQVLFQLLIGKRLAKTSKKRIEEIIKNHGLSAKKIPVERIIEVSSVNAEDCIHQLRNLNPDVVVVHGTRIISKKVLQSINVPFINIHAGITPRYRGSHGAYWALANNDRENCGVTVHLVDAGIDTGNILYQQTLPLTPKDNFATYGYLQLAVGLTLLQKALNDLFEGKMEVKKNNLDSVLWHHPTLWGYIKTRIAKGVR